MDAASHDTALNDTALDDALVEFLYRWNRTETPYDFPVVDLDLLQAADDHPGAFRDRLETGAALAELTAAVDGSTSPYLAAKIDACAALSEVLEGADLPFAEYVRRTLGVVPRMIDEDVLRAESDANATVLDRLGGEHTAAGVAAWIAAHQLDGREVEADFRRAEAALLPAVKAAAGVELDVDYRVEVTSADAYWLNWTSTDDSGRVLVRFNIHPRHVWTAGAPEYLALHEVGGHALQTMSWVPGIEAGTTPRSAGLVAIFTPDMFLMEGLADTLMWLCPGLPLSEVGEWTIRRYRLEQLAANNAQILANDGAPEAEVLEYLDTWAPGYFSADDRRASYAEAVSHPLLRGYKHSYGIGGWTHIQLAASLSPQQRAEYLHAAYTGPLSPADVAAWLQRG